MMATSSSGVSQFTCLCCLWAALWASVAANTATTTIMFTTLKGTSDVINNVTSILTSHASSGSPPLPDTTSGERPETTSTDDDDDDDDFWNRRLFLGIGIGAGGMTVVVMLVLMVVVLARCRRKRCRGKGDPEHSLEMTGSLYDGLTLETDPGSPPAQLYEAIGKGVGKGDQVYQNTTHLPPPAPANGRGPLPLPTQQDDKGGRKEGGDSLYINAMSPSIPPRRAKVRGDALLPPSSPPPLHPGTPAATNRNDNVYMDMSGSKPLTLPKNVKL